MTFVEVKFECINWWGNEVYRFRSNQPGRNYEDKTPYKIQVMRKALTGMNVECAGGVYRLLVPISGDGTCQNKRKSSIFKDPDGSIHDVDAFSKKPVGTYRFDTKTWEKNDKGITWHGGLFEHKDNVLTGRYFSICNIWNHETDKGYMPKPKRIIPCVEVEISPDNWIMAVSADSTELLLLSCDYNIKWEQVSCLKGIRLEDVTPELDSKAYAELKNNKH